jgi:hypothetical protein
LDLLSRDAVRCEPACGVAKGATRHIGAGIFSVVSEVLNLFGYFSV